MRHRLLLSFLIAATLVYYALPRLTPNFEGVQGYFSIAWLLFAFLVIGGNLSAILYTPKRKKNKHNMKSHRTTIKKRQHQYM